ncbi:MAG: alpha/beta hydrolase-fold protein [Oligoflexales bacterium]
MKIIKQNKAFDGQVQVWSHASEMTRSQMTFSAFQPSRPTGVLWVWLSGLTCDHERFFIKSGALALKKAAELGWTILCPDTSPRGCVESDGLGWDIGEGASFYLDATKQPWAKHFRMFSYLHHELRPMALESWGLDTSACVISGHSMGGYGALLAGLKTDFYRSASALSPICSPNSCAWGQKAFQTYLQNPEVESEQWDPLFLMQNPVTEHQTPLFIEQGLSDEFYPEQLQTKQIERVGQSSKYPVMKVRFQEGYDHSYYTVSSFLDGHIDFHRSYLQDKS